ncbi:MAG: LexA repressor [Delftia tsuruhatensis]|nr:MAG: LexA repressor [Delftia tsuruhatensis]
MLPDFTEGDLVLIDPELTPRPGDFVAARNTNQEATFKKYRVRGITESGIDVFELVPLNSDYPVIRSDEHHLSVIGTMVEHRRKFRRGQ